MDTLYLILFLGLILGLFFVLRRIIPPLKGRVGEKLLSSKLSRLPKDQYRVLNNVILPTPKGSSQIDHLVISVYGIFVIETKNYNGWIFGGEYSEYWTQNIYGHKYKLYNPIFQNAGHIRAIRSVLKGYESFPIFPIVAFSRKASIKIKVKEACVVYWNQVRRAIRKHDEHKLTWDQVNAICDTIQSVRLKASKENRKQHRRVIRSVKKQKKDAVSSGKCPRCDGTLVLRNGKYGSFYGCSNYPSCNYTLNK